MEHIVAAQRILAVSEEGLFDSDDETKHFTGRSKMNTQHCVRLTTEETDSTQRTTTLRGVLPLMASHIVKYEENPEDSNLKPVIGTLASIGQLFCPILAIAKFPYKFIHDKVVKEQIADAYFNAGSFWRLSWDLYYVWPPQSSSPTPLLLVPLGQVQNLFNKVNQTVTNANISLPKSSKTWGLVLSFESANLQLRPRYLGLSMSYQQFKNLEHHVPSRSFRPSHESQKEIEPKEDDTKQFTRMLDNAVDVSKSGRKNKAARQEQRLTREQNWRGDLKQAERFLGLRLYSFYANLPDEEIEQTWEEVQAQEAARIASKNVVPIRLDSPPPYAFDSNVVCVCVDIESWERDRRKVTEIGISTLNVFEIANIPPGEYAKNWYPKISSHHFRITENSHLQNSDFVNGCASDFRFGNSSFISEKDVPKVMSACFRPTTAAIETLKSKINDEIPASESRTVVLVGHDVGNDVRYLASLGFYTREVENMHRRHSTLDTQDLWRALTGQSERASLASVIQKLDILPWGLHNAGNDATYTLQAMLAIVVRSASERPSKSMGEKTHRNNEVIFGGDSSRKTRNELKGNDVGCTTDTWQSNYETKKETWWNTEQWQGNYETKEGTEQNWG